MSNQKEVIACVTLLAGCLRQEVTTALLEGFCLALADLSESELRRAVGKALCECKFMPAPAELREFAGRVQLTEGEADYRRVARLLEATDARGSAKLCEWHFYRGHGDHGSQEGCTPRCPDFGLDVKGRRELAPERKPESLAAIPGQLADRKAAP